jgi:hypothetical protein
VPIRRGRAVAAAQHGRRGHGTVPRNGHDAKRDGDDGRDERRTREHDGVDADICESRQEIRRERRKGRYRPPREHEPEPRAHDQEHCTLRERLRQQVASLRA